MDVACGDCKKLSVCIKIFVPASSCPEFVKKEQYERRK